MHGSHSNNDIEGLSHVLCSALEGRGLPGPPPDVCCEIIEAWLRKAEQAWPEIGNQRTAFVQYVAERIVSELTLDADDVHVEDLCVAFLANQRHKGALSIIGAHLTEELRLMSSRFGAQHVAEAEQIVWQKLFLETETERPKILDYSGRGRLRSWLRVLVLRNVLDDLRKERAERRTLEGHAILSVPEPEADPETEYLRQLYSKEFTTAFQEAALELSAEERNVLRAYYADGLNIDDLAVMFGIHRATAARRVRKARDLLLDDTRRRLQERLKLSAKELDSIVRLLRSRLHLSVQRLFDSE